MRDIAYIALGSNLGDRAAFLSRARAALGAMPHSRLIGHSRVEETAPVGDVPQGPYLNQMVALETALEPLALLDALQAIERECGRQRTERWGPRTLDLDVVAYEDRVVDEPRLTVPHPELPTRDFWQRELAEVRASVAARSAGAPGLPAWACVKPKRRAHIERVVALLEQWADALAVAGDERVAWLDAGWWHDALRDADEATLRALVPDGGDIVELLHGPAAAARLEREGERRAEVLDAVRWHTVGYPQWSRVGRALYMADFLEPGRTFARADRAFLARQVPFDFDGIFRQVVRERIAWTIREGNRLFPETVSLWNGLR